MGKHKPLSILKRSPAGQQKKRPAHQSIEQNSPQKRRIISAAIEGHATLSPHSTHPAALGPASKKIKAPARKFSAPTNVRPGAWEAVSVVDRQAARAVQQLLKADASGIFTLRGSALQCLRVCISLASHHVRLLCFVSCALIRHAISPVTAPGLQFRGQNGAIRGILKGQTRGQTLQSSGLSVSHIFCLRLACVC